jgi:long-chain acyl-CoA synthetase
MLTHANFVSNTLAISEIIEPLETDRFLSVLPLLHAFEFTCGFLIPMYGGSTIHYVEHFARKMYFNTMNLLNNGML